MHFCFIHFNKHFFITFFILFYCTILHAQAPAVSTGTIKHFEKFQSQYVDARNVDVWLPEGYDKVKNKTFYRALGGGIEFTETSKDAIIREFKEGGEVTANTL